MRLVKPLPKLKLKSIKAAKGNFTAKSYRPLDARLSPELKELARLGRKLVRIFNITPEFLAQALDELRKRK
ncbi:MAG: hypothetical protein ACOX3L_07975 [Lutisporaceae bacterium]